MLPKTNIQKLKNTIFNRIMFIKVYLTCLMNIYTGNGAKRQENDKSVTVGFKIYLFNHSSLLSV